MSPDPPSLRWFRVIALVETATYLVLLTAVLARAVGVGDAVRPLGLGHGIVFLVYLAGVLAVRGRLGWDARRTTWAICAAAIPLGAWQVERSTH